MSDTGPLILHASAVALDGKGLLIRGASGRGKSSLALQLMALGAGLVADDRTIVTPAETGLRLTAPAALRGMIEARGLGLLVAAPVAEATLQAIVDLDNEETERLPQPAYETVLGHAVRRFHVCVSPAFPAALMQYLKAGIRE